MVDEILLKYGMNPHQEEARIFLDGGLPFEVLNGNAGHINFLDALNSWQLVKELKGASGLSSAASFKHVSPSGVGVGMDLSDKLKKAYQVEGMDLSPLAIAYARARGCDRVSSFGDWIALSDRVDESCARLICKEISDGVIAPSYDTKALEILKKKKKGDYRIVQMDSSYVPALIERRDVFGITLEQDRNDSIIDESCLKEIVTKNKNLTSGAKLDMLIGYITLKYTQSNSVCFAYDGQTIGVAAGQQSRVDCTLLAAQKAKKWLLRQHESILSLEYKKGVKRQAKDNAINALLRDRPIASELASIDRVLLNRPQHFYEGSKKEFLSWYQNLTMASDGFIPFRDNIDVANDNGVRNVIQPGGSDRDQEVINACDELKMLMVFTGLRVFHH
jgi:phosphoribosylaminoimidazolecarboxamide formyltransferase / IMP cyclohydrolase